jgi:hypothetical protein
VLGAPSNKASVVSTTHHAPPPPPQELRGRLLRNIGLAFVKLGQYQDALQAFETCTDGAADHQAAWVLCRRSKPLAAARDRGSCRCCAWLAAAECPRAKPHQVRRGARAPSGDVRAAQHVLAWRLT